MFEGPSLGTGGNDLATATATATEIISDLFAPRSLLPYSSSVLRAATAEVTSPSPVRKLSVGVTPVNRELLAPGERCDLLLVKVVKRAIRAIADGFQLMSAVETITPNGLSDEMQFELIQAARNASAVSGLTHKHYRYPARFSPALARAAIRAFTEPGDLVLDPFMGGGTTIVEALAEGRCVVGVDVSALATFVAQAKTLRLEPTEIEALNRWISRIPDLINVHKPTLPQKYWIEAGYLRNLTTPGFWRIKKAIQQCLHSASRLKTANQEHFARAVVLRCAQWALESRRAIPSIQDFRTALIRFGKEMLLGAIEFRSAVESVATPSPHPILINGNAGTLISDSLFQSLRTPKLVVTSPPYPGIHVLYHRWQVDGRKETPAPFWIANRLDGAGASFYTMGDRKEVGHDTYFRSLSEALRSVIAICDSDTVFMHVVSFSRPAEQLPRFLETAAENGMVEFFLPLLNDEEDGRLWRSVPNRRWYTQANSEMSGGREVVLFHRLSRAITHVAIGGLVQRKEHSTEA
jgi:hypothetical protein